MYGPTTKGLKLICAQRCIDNGFIYIHVYNVLGFKPVSSPSPNPKIKTRRVEIAARNKKFSVIQLVTRGRCYYSEGGRKLCRYLASTRQPAQRITSQLCVSMSQAWIESRESLICTRVPPNCPLPLLLSGRTVNYLARVKSCSLE